MKGYVHSFQSLGAVDGKGIRFIVFLQGCDMRCLYCHNPDTWQKNVGNTYDTSEIVERVLRYKTYFGEDGGVTVSGGEALLQSDFVAELFEKLHENNINTALDTSGFCSAEKVEKVLKVTDLVICDIKFTSEQDYKKYCKGSLNTVESFLSVTEKLNIPLWIRNVIVPGINDIKASVEKVSKIATKYKNLEKIELLPFRKLCQTKYDSLGIPFPLKDVEECSEEKIKYLQQLLPKL